MKVIARNRRANFDYAIERTLIAGVVLNGNETKSVRSGLVSLKGAFAHIKNGELWLVNAHITPYPFAAENTHREPTQTRKLLISRRQLDELLNDKESGRSIVPLAILGGRYIKVELGVGKGKKNIDKRETIKKRDAERNAARELHRQS